MSVQFRFTVGVQDDQGSGPLSGAYSEVGTQEIIVDQTFPASTTDGLVSVGVVFTVAALQGIEIISDQNATLETNSGTSPSNTINLKAGIPFWWSKSPGYFANPFTVDVTNWYLTCTSATRLRARILK